MAQNETVDKILDAAEVLFAEKGFAETSLRMITSKAKVNLAAVNYHFGSKNALIQAVFSRFLGPFTRLMEEGLKERGWDIDEDFVPDLEELLTLYTQSWLNIPTRSENGIVVFMRLLGVAYTQSQGHLRKYLESEYALEFATFMGWIKKCTPQLSTEERFWRMQFTMGALAFTMSSIQPLSEILQNDADANADPEKVMELIVPYLLAGLRTAPTLS